MLLEIDCISCQRLFVHSYLDSGVAVLFDWNLSRHPFLKQVVDLDLLLAQDSILKFEPEDLFRYLMLNQRPKNDEKLSSLMSAALFMKFTFYTKKNSNY